LYIDYILIISKPDANERQREWAANEHTLSFFNAAVKAENKSEIIKIGIYGLKGSCRKLEG